MDLNAFVLSHLPPPPARVLEVGCGRAGGLARALDAAGHDVLAIDPEAPEGEIFRRTTLEELDGPGLFDAAVAARVLHHVDLLEAAAEKLARLASLLILDEFAPERIDERAKRWYEAHRATLSEPSGPEDLGEWRDRHLDLHPSDLVLGAVRASFEERFFERRPYFYYWLRDPETESVERAAIEEGELPALGWRWVGRPR